MTSPASRGPAGTDIEGRVGAYYLLTMVLGIEPLGLPGAKVRRVEFQRGAEGRALDDVIVHGRDHDGNAAVLEVQVKRAISFSASNQAFKKVTAQILEASRRPDFWNSRYELAVATARTSIQITGDIPDVLSWARGVQSGRELINRVRRSGSGNDRKRKFLAAFRKHLADCGGRNDEETVWRLLRRLQVLVFDFANQGSLAHALAHELASRALHPDHQESAEGLWTSMVELAIAEAARGGACDRARVVEELRRRGFRLAGQDRYATAHRALDEGSFFELADISDPVDDVSPIQVVPKVPSGLAERRYAVGDSPFGEPTRIVEIRNSERSVYGMVRAVYDCLEGLDRKLDCALEPDLVLQAAHAKVAEGELSTIHILRLRMFDHNEANERTRDLWRRVDGGDLAAVPEAVKTKVCYWVARLRVSRLDGASEARSLRQRLSHRNTDENLQVLDALIKAADADFDGAFRLLRDDDSADARSLLLWLLVRHRGEQAALEWCADLRPAASPKYFTAIGWRTWAVCQGRVGNWKEAADGLRAVASNFDWGPGLAMIEGAVNAALLLPAEHRTLVFRGIPTYTGMAPNLSVEARGRHERARECFRHALRSLSGTASKDGPIQL